MLQKLVLSTLLFIVKATDYAVKFSSNRASLLIDGQDIQDIDLGYTIYSTQLLSISDINLTSVDVYNRSLSQTTLNGIASANLSTCLDTPATQVLQYCYHNSSLLVSGFNNTKLNGIYDLDGTMCVSSRNYVNAYNSRIYYDDLFGAWLLVSPNNFICPANAGISAFSFASQFQHPGDSVFNTSSVPSSLVNVTCVNNLTPAVLAPSPPVPALPLGYVTCSAASFLAVAGFPYAYINGAYTNTGSSCSGTPIYSNGAGVHIYYDNGLWYLIDKGFSICPHTSGVLAVSSLAPSTIFPGDVSWSSVIAPSPSVTCGLFSPPPLPPLSSACGAFSFTSNQTLNCTIFVPAGSFVRIGTCSNIPNAVCTDSDTMMTVYDVNSTYIAFNDDGPEGSPMCGLLGLCSSVNFTNTGSDMTFTISQTCYPGTTCSGVVGYDITLPNSPPPSPRQYFVPPVPKPPLPPSPSPPPSPFPSPPPLIPVMSTCSVYDVNNPNSAHSCIIKLPAWTMLQIGSCGFSISPNCTEDTILTVFNASDQSVLAANDDGALNSCGLCSYVEYINAGPEPLFVNASTSCYLDNYTHTTANCSSRVDYNLVFVGAPPPPSPLPPPPSTCVPTQNAFIFNNLGSQDIQTHQTYAETSLMLPSTSFKFNTTAVSRRNATYVVDPHPSATGVVFTVVLNNASVLGLYSNGTMAIL